MSVGIFMSNQPQPVVWHHAPHVNQDGDWISLQIAKPIHAKRLNQRSRKNLNRPLLPNVKAIVTPLKIGVQLTIHPINMVADPGADRHPLMQVIH